MQASSRTGPCAARSAARHAAALGEPEWMWLRGRRGGPGRAFLCGTAALGREGRSPLRGVWRRGAPRPRVRQEAGATAAHGSARQRMAHGTTSRTPEHHARHADIAPQRPPQPRRAHVAAAGPEVGRRARRVPSERRQPAAAARRAACFGRVLVHAPHLPQRRRLAARAAGIPIVARRRRCVRAAAVAVQLERRAELEQRVAVSHRDRGEPALQPQLALLSRKRVDRRLEGVDRLLQAPENVQWGMMQQHAAGT